MKTLQGKGEELQETEAMQSPAWFCVRTQPKHEHIAAGRLRNLDGIEVFLPRLRFRRKTVKGAAWVTEGMFPNYLFARFDWRLMLRAVQYSSGVLTVVHFGQQWPTIPDGVIASLRKAVGTEEVRIVPEPFEAGKQVEVVEGPFKGFDAVIVSSLPGRERIRVLMDFLGRQTPLELPASILIGKTNPRQLVD